MPIVEPPAARHIVQDEGTKLEIIIPTPRNWVKLALEGLWLIPIGIILVYLGGSIVISLLFAVIQELERPSGEIVGGFLFGLFGLAFGGLWFGSGAAGIYAYLWDLAGKEIIQATPNSLTVSQRLLSYDRSKEYGAEHIRNLRVSAPPAARGRFDTWTRRAFKVPANGMIAFDYGAKTFRFGLDLDEAEAEQIVATILRRFPRYGKGLL